MKKMSERFAYYIHVTQTINSSLESDLWINSVAQQACETNSDHFCDISDDQTLSNQFLIENPGCLKLILLAFEIVNPLGSAKKNTKLLQSICWWQICLHMCNPTQITYLNLKQFECA